MSYGNDEPTRGFVFYLDVFIPASLYAAPRRLKWHDQTYDTGFDLDDHPRLLYGRLAPGDHSRIEIDALSADGRTRRRA